METTIIIPAFNEEKKIAKTVFAAKSLSGVDQVIVIDDGSRDLTGDSACSAGAEVVRIEPNRGKGNALNVGAKQVRGRLVLLLDADLGDTALEAEKLLHPVLNGEADMTIAKLTPTKKGSGGFGFVKGLAINGVYLLTGRKISTVLSGQRAMRYDVLQKLIPFAEGFGVEVAMTIKAAKYNFRIKEVPVDMKHSETSKDLHGFIHRGKQFLHILKVLLYFFLRSEKSWGCRWQSRY